MRVVPASLRRIAAHRGSVLLIWILLLGLAGLPALAGSSSIIGTTALPVVDDSGDLVVQPVVLPIAVPAAAVIDEPRHQLTSQGPPPDLESERNAVAGPSAEPPATATPPVTTEPPVTAEPAAQPASDPAAAPVTVAAAPGVALSESTAATAAAQPAGGAPIELVNGGFDLDLDPWFVAAGPATTVAVVVDDGPDPELEVVAGASPGSVAQDLPIAPVAGTRYAAAIRARSVTGHPILVELAVHGLAQDGTIAESASRVVLIEGDEVPITATLVPTADHNSLRVEAVVHTVDRRVRLDDAALLVDGAHRGPGFYGYQQPRVTYLDGVDLAALEPGGRYRVEVSVTTTTDQPWERLAETGSIRLGTEDDDLVGGSGRASGLFPGAGGTTDTSDTIDAGGPDAAGSNWLSPNRIGLDQESTSVGGTFTATIVAPEEPGPFAERFRLVAEDVIWLPGPVIEIIGGVVAPPAVIIDRNHDGLADPTDAGASCGDPESATCQARVAGIVLTAVAVTPGSVTLSWLPPGGPAEAETEVERRYVVRVWNRADGPGGGERPPTTVFLTTEPELTVQSLPVGSYDIEILTRESDGRWTSSGVFTVVITEPVPAPQHPPAEACETTTVVFETPLMGYPGHDLSPAVPVELRCTGGPGWLGPQPRYEIHLRSTDTRHRPGYQPEQTAERWYLEGLDAAGEVVYTSPPIPDLPEADTELTVQVDVTTLDGVVAVRARHLRERLAPDSVGAAVVLVPA